MYVLGGLLLLPPADHSKAGHSVVAASRCRIVPLFVAWFVIEVCTVPNLSTSASCAWVLSTRTLAQVVIVQWLVCCEEHSSLEVEDAQQLLEPPCEACDSG